MVNVKEKIEEGYLHVRVIMEVVGKPKEHVEETLKDIMGKIKDEKNIEVLTEHTEEAVKQKDTELFTSFTEFEGLFKDMLALSTFCYCYMPSSVEVIEPHVIKLKDSDVSAIFSDLQAKLHAMDMAIKQAKFENIFLSKNFNNLLKNIVLIVLVERKMMLEEISKVTGVQEEELSPALEELVKENRIKKEENKFSLV